MSFAKTPGQRVKEERLKAGMTQDDLAKLLNVGRSLIWRWESGSIATIRRGNIEQLAKVFHCSPEYLLYGYKGGTLPLEIEDWLHDAKNTEKVIKFYYESVAKEKMEQTMKELGIDDNSPKK